MFTDIQQFPDKNLTHRIATEALICRSRHKWRRHDTWLQDTEYEVHLMYFPPIKNEQATCEVYIYDREGREHLTALLTL